jgi:acyl carrier protein
MSGPIAASKANGASMRPNQSNADQEANRPTAVAFASWLQELVANILDIAPTSAMVDKSFDALGIDSLTAVSLTDEVQRYLKRPIDGLLFLEYNTIRAATAHLFPNG